MGKDNGHSKKSETVDSGFEPMSLVVMTPEIGSSSRLTVTSTLKGLAAEEFQAMCEKAGINRSQLVTQMVYHCLNRTADLKDFYKRLAILGK